MSSVMRLLMGVVFLVNAFAIVNSERTKDRMYVPLEGASCFRRLNGTHETGCSSKFGGSTGVLHVVRSDADFAFIHNAPPAPPYAVVVPAALFTRANIMPLQHSPHVAAIVLIRNATRPAHYSHELQCPNQYSSYNNATCDADTVWNTLGTGMLFESFPFPILYVSDADQVATVVQCFDRFNAVDLAGQHQRSLCSIEINQFMSAAGNAEICLRRSLYEHNMKPTTFCDAMRGSNLYATLFARPIVDGAASTSQETNGNGTTAEPAADAEQFIIVSARLDSNSMFDGIAPGAMELMPFVTLLSTAHALAALLPERRSAGGGQQQPNVLFMLFNGEAYDYIGSQRMAYDMRSGRFPPPQQRRSAIRPEQVVLHIDLAGLDAPTDNLWAYHVHQFGAATELLSALDKYNRAFGLNVNVNGRQQADVPPSSVHAFARELGATAWPSVVLRSPTANRYLHSVFDDAANVGFEYRNTTTDFERLVDVLSDGADGRWFAADALQMAVRNVSTVLAFTLYELVTKRPYEGRLGPSAVLVDELLYCYLNATECRAMRAALPPNWNVGRMAAPSRYVSVQSNYVQEVVGLTHELLGWLVGQRRERTRDECNADVELRWMAGVNGTGECRLAVQNYSMAYSPAFTMGDYDLTSGRYSTWTESTWSEMSARIYLKPSAAHEALTLAIGFVVMTFSFVLVFLVNSRSDVLFGRDGSVAASMIAASVATASTAPAQC